VDDNQIAVDKSVDDSVTVNATEHAEAILSVWEGALALRQARHRIERYD
jgi:hypothetical protein